MPELRGAGTQDKTSNQPDTTIILGVQIALLLGTNRSQGSIVPILIKERQNYQKTQTNLQNFLNLLHETSSQLLQLHLEPNYLTTINRLLKQVTRPIFDKEYCTR